MMRLLPQWVGALHKDLEAAIEELAYDYGLDRQTIMDSSSIKAAVSNIVGNFEYTAGIQREGIRPQWWYEDRKFGNKREKVNAEEKKSNRDFERRSKEKAKGNKK
jgi:hypothetical protein